MRVALVRMVGKSDERTSRRSRSAGLQPCQCGAGGPEGLHYVRPRRRLPGLVGLIVALAVALPAAQFGHPLKGSWSGDWGPTKDNRTRVLIDINWDGKALAGVINPGPNAVPMQKATLDPSTWAVHFEAERKDASGQAIRYVIDGKLENIGAYQRFITGTWTEGTRKGDFKIVRN